MTKSNIEWTQAVWNPTTGCDRVSPGCDNCYALTMAKRLKGMGAARYQRDGNPRTSGPGFGVTVHPGVLLKPLTWATPRRVFVNSMSDLFHDEVPDAFIAQVFAVMALSPSHTFQLLTKRHARMRALLSGQFSDRGYFGWKVKDAMWDLVGRSKAAGRAWRAMTGDTGWWPLRNLHLGVSVENQRWADTRIPHLLDTPAAVRWLSMEPLLGPVALDPFWLDGRPSWAPSINWIVVGGESGPSARPMHPDWARSLRDQCNAADVPFFFKQWGEWAFDGDGTHDHRNYIGLTADGQVFEGPHSTVPTELLTDPARYAELVVMRRAGKKASGRLLDGRTWDEYPAVVS